MFDCEEELDQLLCNVRLYQRDPEEGGGNFNNDSNIDASQVPLFLTVGSLTDEPLNGTDLATVNEDSNGERRKEGGPCQRPALSISKMNTD